MLALNQGHLPLSASLVRAAVPLEAPIRQRLHTGYGPIQSDSAEVFADARMGLILGGWRKRGDDDREAVLRWADQTLEQIEML